jgi:hypothetical protein
VSIPPELRNVATNELFPALSIPRTATMGHAGAVDKTRACSNASDNSFANEDSLGSTALETRDPFSDSLSKSRKLEFGTATSDLATEVRQLVGAVKDSDSIPLLTEPVVGSHIFQPNSWFEVLVGDELFSRSGTKRLVRAISSPRSSTDSRALEFEFLTTKPDRQPYRESFPSKRLLVANLTQVVRKSRAQFIKVAPQSWHDIFCGDLVVSKDGERRVIS